MKTLVRFFFLAVVTIFCVTLLVAQNATKDVIYLKNGSVIKGTILEMVMDKGVKIQTADGSVFVYTMAEVEKIGKEAAAPSAEPLMQSQQRTTEGAKSSFIIYGGGAIPMGDFAKDDMNSEKSGFAKTGWLAGAQFVTGGTIGFLIDASYSSIPVNLDKMIASELEGIPSSFKVDKTIKGWSSILLLGGVKIGTSNPTGANFFVAPLVGMNIVNTFDVSVKVSGTESVWINGYSDSYYPYTYHSGYYANINVIGEEKVASVSKTVVVYGAAVEVIAGSITIGVRYIACKPEYDLERKVTATASYPGITPSTSTSTDKFQYKPDISIIQAYLGFAF